MYRLTTAAMPFQAPTTSLLLEAIVRHTLASPQSLNPALPTQFERVIVRLLEKEPGRRHSSADELLHELERVRASLSTPVSALNFVPPAEGGRSSP